MSRLHTPNNAQLKERLDALCLERDPARALRVDPIRFPRSYASEADQEVVAILAALLAYGRVSAIGGAVSWVTERLGPSPAESLRRDTPAAAGERFEGFVYRFTRGPDLARVWLGLGDIARERGGVGEALRGWEREEGWGASPHLLPHLTRLHDEVLARGARHLEALTPGARASVEGGTGLAHLWSNPRGGSALKRLNMLTRWLARGPDEVDLGLWRDLGPHRLTMPLDAHVFRAARALSLTRRPSPSWSAAREVTAHLALLCPEDPLRYDFALAHLGISGDCLGYREASVCARCPLEPLCGLEGRRGA